MCGFVVEVAVVEHESEVIDALLSAVVRVKFQFLFDGAHIHWGFHHLEIVLCVCVCACRHGDVALVKALACTVCTCMYMSCAELLTRQGMSQLYGWNVWNDTSHANSWLAASSQVHVRMGHYVTRYCT